jgi:hypothetical protein
MGNHCGYERCRFNGLVIVVRHGLEQSLDVCLHNP